MNHIDEALTVVYIEEDLKSLTKDKVKTILASLKKPNAKTLETAYRMTKSNKTLRDIETYATKKSPEFKKAYANELKNAKHLTNQFNKKVYALTMASAKQMKRFAVQKRNKKLENAVDKFIMNLEMFFKKAGKAVLTVGVIVKLISLFSSHLFAIAATAPELSAIYTAALSLSPYAIWIIAAGVILLVLAYLLKIWSENRAEEKEYSGTSKSPYDED